MVSAIGQFWIKLALQTKHAKQMKLSIYFSISDFHFLIVPLVQLDERFSARFLRRRSSLSLRNARTFKIRLCKITNAQSVWRDERRGNFISNSNLFVRNSNVGISRQELASELKEFRRTNTTRKIARVTGRTNRNHNSKFYCRENKKKKKEKSTRSLGHYQVNTSIHCQRNLSPFIQFSATSN